MHASIPAALTPNTMLVASLALVVLLMVVFLRRSLSADRLVAAAELRVESQVERVAALEAELTGGGATADRDDVLQLLERLPRALRIPEDAKTRRQIGEALGASIASLLEPQQWMVFIDVEGDGKQFALVATAAASGGTWPLGACLTPQMGRVGLAIRRKKAMDALDFLAEPPIVRAQFTETEPGVFRVDSVVPIIVRDRVVGAIAAGGSAMPPEVTRAILQVVADQAALLHRLATVYQRAAELENIDDVTGLHNRNWFTAQGSEMVFRNRDQLVPMVCAVLGIDDFRIYAAREGPSRAQKLLLGIANLLAPQFREGDLICRWTEHEFALLLPNRDRGSACELLDAVRRRVAAEPFAGAEHQPEGAVTMSVGVAVAPEDGHSFDHLVDHAYRAFQTSRRRGVDRTSGEIDVDDEFLDVVSDLAHETPLRAPGGRRDGPHRS